MYHGELLMKKGGQILWLGYNHNLYTGFEALKNFIMI